MPLAEVRMQAISCLPHTARCTGASQRLRLQPVFSELLYSHVEAVDLCGVLPAACILLPCRCHITSAARA